MITLSNTLTEWSDYLQSLNYASRSIECYHEECALFIRWLNRTHSVLTSDQMRKEHLFSWQKHLSGRRNAKGEPLSPKTINRKIASVRNLLSYLAERGYILKTLTEALCPVKEPQLLPHGVLNHSKMKKALSKMPAGTPAQYRNRTMLETLYSTAVRARELLGLDITSVDIKNGTATVMGKGSKERVVPIGKTAMRYLETYMKAVRPFLEKDGYSKALFLSVKGERLAYASFLEIVHKHCDGVSDFSVTPHTFRRSCTTEMIKGGANLYHVKELLGHESIDALRPYIKLTIKDLKKTHAKCHPRERDG